MHHKKTTSKTPEQEALEKHVDAMMDPKRPDELPGGVPAAPASAPAPVPSAPSTAQATASTAPQLSAKLRKQIGIKDESAEPIHIKKLDELTKTITDSKPSEPPAPKKPDEPAAKPKPHPEEPPQTAEPQSQTGDLDDQGTDLDDEQTDKAVDDIMAYESDVMLAVADSTAEARNQELAEPEPKGHSVFSTLFWVLIALLAMLIIAVIVLLVMGDSLTNKLGM